MTTGTANSVQKPVRGQVCIGRFRDPARAQGAFSILRWGPQHESGGVAEAESFLLPPPHQARLQVLLSSSLTEREIQNILQRLLNAPDVPLNAPYNESEVQRLLCNFLLTFPEIEEIYQAFVSEPGQEIYGLLQAIWNVRLQAALG